MKSPIILTDDDTPLYLSFTFKGAFGEDAKLTVNFKPMLRIVESELEGMPNFTDEQMKEGAANLGMTEVAFREEWGKRRQAFQDITLRKTMEWLQNTIPETIADVMEALLITCRFNAIIDTVNIREFRSVPVAATSYKRSGVADFAWDQVRKRLNQRLGIQPGLSLDVEGFWLDMETAWRKLNKPAAYLSHLTQKEFAKALGVEDQALRNRIKRNLRTNWNEFKKALKERLTMT